MGEERLFTVEEARKLLPDVTLVVEDLKAAHQVMAERQDEVETSIPTNGGGARAREYIEAARRAAQAIGALNSLGVLVRDPETGLIDFPSVRDGEPVFLCWRLGEPDLAWWHPRDSGIAGRQPL